MKLENLCESIFHCNTAGGLDSMLEYSKIKLFSQTNFHRPHYICTIYPAIDFYNLVRIDITASATAVSNAIQRQIKFM